MNIGQVLNGLEPKTKDAALQRFLDGFLNPAFGALPKAEVELLVLELLEAIGAINDEPSVYELVSNLRVTRSKARRLIYDRELRRRSTADLDQMAIDVLRRPSIQKSGELFVLEVENPLVSDHLRS